MKTLDLRKLKCPHPAIQSRKALLDKPGSELTVLVGDETARNNICRLADNLNYTTQITVEGDAFHIVLSPDTAKQKEKGPNAARRNIIFIASETMGSGDDELGRLLLKNYLITLTEMSDLPSAVYMVNAGVKLVCEESELLEVFDKIASRGIDIAACGLCLEFFHLQTKQAIGRTTNMLEIATELQAADSVIRP